MEPEFVRNAIIHATHVMDLIHQTVHLATQIIIKEVYTQVSACVQLDTMITVLMAYVLVVIKVV
jgi:hypothetical protein